MADDDPHGRPTARPSDADAAVAATGTPTLPSGARGAARPAAPARKSDDLSGGVIGDRYRVIEKLGEGGMGVVYVAEHIKLEKRVAIKVLSGKFAKHEELLQRFVQEAKAATRIGHENIIDVTDFGLTPGGAPFFAMELLAGRDLARLIRGDGAVELPRIAAILGQVCRAVGAAHAKNIFHRDLKPENIFLVEREGRSDFVKILDFGIAKVSQLAPGARLTRTGTIFGTAEYMSPEQAQGGATDHRSDVYAVGCILYEMLTGDVPFRAASFMATLQLQVAEPPPSPSLRAPGRVTPALEAVVLKALAKAPDARFQSLAALHEALTAALRPGAQPALSTIAPDAAPTATRSPRALLVVGALSIIAVAVAGVTWAWRIQSRLAAETPAIAVPAISAAPITNSAAPIANSAAPTTSPTATTPASSGAAAIEKAPSRISVSSHPAGADVRDAAGTHLGRTPLELRFAPSTPPFEVTVERHGYLPQKVHVTPDHDCEFMLELPPLKPAHVTPPAPAPTPEHPAPRELKTVE